MGGNSKKVSLVKGPQRYENIKKALEFIRPDLDTIKSKKRILIKPNLTATKNVFANTDPQAVEAIIDFLLDTSSEFRLSLLFAPARNG